MMRTDAKWYIDGSMINARWKQHSSCGFAIAVVTDRGDIVAYGRGVPPEWTDSAAAAEAGALCTIAQIIPFWPWVVTDCLGLIKMAERGHHAAGAASMQLART